MDPSLRYRLFHFGRPKQLCPSRELASRANPNVRRYASVSAFEGKHAIRGSNQSLRPEQKSTLFSPPTREPIVLMPQLFQSGSKIWARGNHRGCCKTLGHSTTSIYQDITPLWQESLIGEAGPAPVLVKNSIVAKHASKRRRARLT